jgi:hypothetical protein
MLLAHALQSTTFVSHPLAKNYVRFHLGIRSGNSYFHRTRHSRYSRVRSTPKGKTFSTNSFCFITLYLDRVYPGEVTRIGVDLWGDTGKVVHARALSG